MTQGNEGIVNDGGAQSWDAVVYGELGDDFNEAATDAAEAAGARVTVTGDTEQALRAWGTGARLLVLGLAEEQPTFLRRWPSRILFEHSADNGGRPVAVSNNRTVEDLVMRGNHYRSPETKEEATTLLTGLFRALHEPVQPDNADPISSAA